MIQNPKNIDFKAYAVFLFITVCGCLGVSLGTDMNSKQTLAFLFTTIAAKSAGYVWDSRKTNSVDKIEKPL